jgi:hypothetical protein
MRTVFYLEERGPVQHYALRQLRNNCLMEAALSRIRPAGQRMGNQNSYRRHDPGPRSVGQPVNLCLGLVILFLVGMLGTLPPALHE